VSVECPYCGQEAELVGGDVIYPYRPDLFAKRFWQCAPCHAYVGCHKDTGEPLGRLANAELRRAKMAAHAAFDPLWRTFPKKERNVRRKRAYAWLAKALGIPREECHIGMFDVDMCYRVIEICEENPF